MSTSQTDGSGGGGGVSTSKKGVMIITFTLMFYFISIFLGVENLIQSSHVVRAPGIQLNITENLSLKLHYTRRPPKRQHGDVLSHAKNKTVAETASKSSTTPQKNNITSRRKRGHLFFMRVL